MDGGDDLLHRVVEEDRDAVGVVDGEAQAGLVGDQPVGVVGDGVEEVGQDVGPFGHPDGVLMDLMGHDQALLVSSHRGAEPGVVLPDGLGPVVAGEPQVQLGAGAGADAPQPGGEPVGDAPGGGQGIGGVENHVVFGLLGKCHKTPRWDWNCCRRNPPATSWPSPL